jgi:adhesin transport system membrane fusion protein
MEETKEQAAKLRLELAKANENLTAYTDKRSREEVRAPMDGVVNKLYFQTVGGVIRAGEPVAEIVPVDQTVIVEARVAPRDRGNVWPGLAASIKISAYDAAVYGGLDAKVVEVSPDVIQDPKGESYYRVRLKADATGFGRDKPVIAGMTADVAIKAGEQTILNYLLGPLIGIRDGALRE